jgi:hypothetical protein
MWESFDDFAENWVVEPFFLRMGIVELRVFWLMWEEIHQWAVD